jgi:hypothetical protein
MHEAGIRSISVRFESKAYEAPKPVVWDNWNILLFKYGWLFAYIGSQSQLNVCYFYLNHHYMFRPLRAIFRWNIN